MKRTIQMFVAFGFCFVFFSSSTAQQSKSGTPKPSVTVETKQSTVEKSKTYEGLKISVVEIMRMKEHPPRDPLFRAGPGHELVIVVVKYEVQPEAREGEIERDHAEGNVLVVSHKATIRIILCSLLGIDVGRFRYRLACPVGSLSILEFSLAGPLLHTLADRSHLNETLRSLPGT